MDKKKREEEEVRQLKEKREQIEREKEMKKDICLQRRARCKEGNASPFQQLVVFKNNCSAGNPI